MTAEGGSVTGVSQGGPVNMTGSSMWQTQELHLNREKETGKHQSANFANFVETPLSYSSAFV